MTINYFEGYFEELRKLKRERKRFLELKDRSICPCCESRISREKTDSRLIELNELFEKLEIKLRKYNVKINEVKFRDYKIIIF